ncbi:type VI secretion system contractile sheath large subunit [Colwellia sp. MB3u-28]|nr:type VI secretion system contractile sheath large subunit [Colwellia sp. MB02u-7]MBA6236111.1 type VI secretion system contractile sheath large subunit [Colwellia sp. MB02u-11]MBA6256635.1 type VI secretion system contractile sheath large subunit [Colwellia sp. MB3u-28]MBA6261350.1 type VI secretion system contractile sheath large subunit [Colwellia sp. MB3u-41]MBA6298484.1 type VI secretion system contractile sheath large subunit [Colwellia sp. MB3u-22]MBA6311691.1 type VI secretion system
MALVEEAKAAEPEDTATLDNARKSFLKLAKDTQPLSTQQKSLSESLQSEDNLVLDEAEQAADYFLSSLAIALFNDILSVDDDESSHLAAIRQKVRNLTSQINDKLDEDLNAIVHDENFKAMEANWLGLHNLIESTDWSADVMIDVFDCTKEELGEDLENNAVDLINGEFFKKVYVAEYDQFGGLPYGAIIGLYEFENTREDRAWLSTMGKLANASHAPFISSVGPKFFGCKNIEEMADIRDLRAHMSHPRFEKWQAMRDTEEAAYIGLTLPRFLLRAPYHAENNPAGAGLTYEEEIRTQKGGEDFLWCNASLLFAKNMIGSFINSGWCQYLRGPKGGGKIEHLPRYAFDLNGQQEIKAPIEMVIPDYRELAFADLGFIPLIYRKGGSEACFFSSQSIKKSNRFKDPHDSENSQLVTNLSYTLSITRIAHYVKCIMRDNIGSSADGPYINNVLQTWLSQYVTTVVNPDDLTLRYYPFKAAQVITTSQEGMIGWYNSEITILPHIQFEGLDVELKMDVRI